ncbi:hypothetical protein JCM17846_21660 [Iodidimonas nitroreducens]|uniref:Oligosaccharide repeat unit polymerase n=1 Tax=Iodidimonas nitroreducens TaxID=1236968 RepID=A0A5A7N9M3_9PROT|nr:O-antigen polymerase [Iodidimonas nitroreducens]GAK33536.1 hypothetical protein AQ1_01426 [alpha proteobacterium Q-1]GER04484.1 hypothetical protein JCM17846_21660 [Iodidimonas nitroreducens]
MNGAMDGLVVALAGSFAFGSLMAISLYAARSWFHPAVAWNGIWFVVFACLCFAQMWLYPVSWQALGIFLAGALYFSFGTLLGSLRWRAASPAEIPATIGLAKGEGLYQSDRVLLLAVLVLLVIGLPFYLRHIMSFSSSAPFTPIFFLEVRQGMLDEAQSAGRGALVNNLVVLSTFATLVALAVTEGGRRWRLLIAALFALAVFYNLLTAAKGGMLSLLVGSFAVYGLTRKRLPVKALIILMVLVLIAFGGITVLRNSLAADSEMTLMDAAGLTGQIFLNYLTTSAVAFSVYLDGIEQVPEIKSPWEFFIRTINYFGTFFEAPNPPGKFIELGPGVVGYNTYSIYFFYYPHYGMLGVAGFMFLLGLISGAVHKLAQSGSLPWLLVYAMLFYGIILGILADALLTSLNPIIKLVLFGAVFVVARHIRLFDPSARRPRLGRQTPSRA